MSTIRIISIFVGLVASIHSSSVAETLPFEQGQKLDTIPSAITTDRGLINIAHYGAKCDGHLQAGNFVGTDDTAAINAAFEVLRSRSLTGLRNSWQIGGTGKLIGPGGVCIVTRTINATRLYGGGMEADLSGTVLLGRTGNAPVVDATGSGNFRFTNLSIQGDCDKETPKLGLVLGRITNNGVGADHNYLDRPVINGCFTQSAYLNVASETTLVQAGTFFNWQPGAYGAIWDGINHFDFESQFLPARVPKDTRQSFNENVCISCIVGSVGDGGIPAWFSNATRHQFIRGFFTTASIVSAAPVPGVVLYFKNGSLIQQLDLAVHFESFPSLQSAIRIEGEGDIEIGGLRVVDQYPENFGSFFSLGQDVRSVSIEDADLHLYQFGSKTGNWFDNSSRYRLAGVISAHNNQGWERPSVWSGTLCVEIVCTVTSAAPR